MFVQLGRAVDERGSKSLGESYRNGASTDAAGRLSKVSEDRRRFLVASTFLLTTNNFRASLGSGGVEGHHEEVP